jgi:disulfide bond formation protein DsbB
MKNIAFIAAVAAGLALEIAHGSERWFGLIPCEFCLLERWPYNIALALGVVALFWPQRWLLWLIVAVFAGAAALSFVHVGVEMKWWPDPIPACSAPDFRGMTIAQRLAAMPARAAKPCGDPDYLFSWLPVSFAQMTFLYGLAVCAGLAMWVSRTPKERAVS